MTTLDKACWERGCPCYDPKEGEGVEVVEKKEVNLLRELNQQLTHQLFDYRAAFMRARDREWVGFTAAERDEIVPMLVQSLINHDDKTMTVLLRAILIDVEERLKEKNSG